MIAANQTQVDVPLDWQVALRMYALLPYLDDAKIHYTSLPFAHAAEQTKLTLVFTLRLRQ